MSPPRVLIVVNNPSFFLSHRLPIALAARDAGWDVHVATAPEPADAVDRIEEQTLQHHPIPLSRSGTQPLEELKTLRALYHLYRELRLDLLHHVTIKPVVYGGLVARVAGCPAVVSAISGLGYVFAGESLRHRALQAVATRLYRAALRHPKSRVIFQNAYDRRTLEDLGITDPARAVMIRGSGVRLDQFSISPEPEGTPVVLLPARMLRDKGVVEFAEAARALKSREIDARFVLAGDLDPGNPAALERDTLDNWVADGIVEWWGHCTDMPTTLKQCHLVVLPSFYGEGLPKALIEAAASGRAIVTTDHPGCRDAVADGDNGLLVPPRDSDALADAIHALLEDPERRRAMGHRGRERAEAEFSVDEVVRQHLEVYEALLNESRSQKVLSR
ncbi:glycosyltransferase family 4 protein [Halorhodospira sp. 9621]|uniref:glycosyltransferase family 4 protein n=1 Tax=Halorhodospira sp. 9621 TaxID=2899135 RepID=UPI001EE87502|nr:glycosyltransferase family 4 protein [Halorhodospira sp. 9621]